MPIYVDDQPVALNESDLGQALELVTRRLEPQGRVIVEVILNGASLVGDDLMQHAQDSLAGAELKLYSADPRDLALHVLRQVREGLRTAGEAQAQAANLFQKDQSGAAMKCIGEALVLWQQAQQAVLHSAQLMGVELDQQSFEGEPLATVTNGLLAQLNDLRDRLQNNDTLGLADALLYEWPATIERWQRLIQQVIHWVEAAPGRERRP
jgi:hypothetical protein